MFRIHGAREQVWRPATFAVFSHTLCTPCNPAMGIPLLGDCGTHHRAQMWLNLDPCGLVCAVFVYGLIAVGVAVASVRHPRGRSANLGLEIVTADRLARTAGLRGGSLGRARLRLGSTPLERHIRRRRPRDRFACTGCVAATPMAVDEALTAARWGSNGDGSRRDSEECHPRRVRLQAACLPPVSVLQATACPPLLHLQPLYRENGPPLPMGARRLHRPSALAAALAAALTAAARLRSTTAWANSIRSSSSSSSSTSTPYRCTPSSSSCSASPLALAPRPARSAAWVRARVARAPLSSPPPRPRSVHRPRTGNVAVMLLVMETMLFGLFTGCMLADQLSNLSSGLTGA